MKVKSTPHDPSHSRPQTASGAPRKERRQFDEAFRKHAVSLIQSGRSVAQVSRELDVPIYSLYEWKRKFRRQIDLNAPLPKTVEGLEDEISRLREALQRSQMREEILKKSLGIFVEAPGGASPSSKH